MNERAALAKIMNLFQEQGLAAPWLPAELAGQMRELAPGVFASTVIDSYLYDQSACVARYLDTPAPAASLALGFAGHGLASQAVHYYLTGPRIGVFLQMRWGTLFDHPDDDGPYWKILLKQTRELWEQAEKSIPLGQRLVVVESSFGTPRFALIDEGQTEPAWRDCSPRGAPLFAAMALKRR